MKNRLGIILSLLLILALDGLVLAEKMNGGNPSFSPDGIGVSQNQRRRRRKRRKVRRPATYQISVSPDKAAAPPETEAAPEPAAAPVQQEMPNTMSAPAPPPPPASSPMDAPGMGRPSKKAGPRIKPPTVQIKPPTE